MMLARLAYGTALVVCGMASGAGVSLLSLRWPAVPTLLAAFALAMVYVGSRVDVMMRGEG